MMMLKALLAILASLPAQDEIWKHLASGDRVQITFRSGCTLLGSLAARPADPRVPADPVDYQTSREITLDVSLEYPGLHGTLTIPKMDIQSIRRLDGLDAQALRKLRERLAAAELETARDEAGRKSRELERDLQKKKEAAAAAALAQDASKKDPRQTDLEKGKDLLKRFPPDKYGPQSLSDLARMKLLHQIPPADLRDFADPEVQRLWKLALQAVQPPASGEGAPAPDPGNPQ